MTKRCKYCGKLKPTTDFAKQSTGKHGVRSNCKPCQTEIQQAYNKTYDGQQARAKANYQRNKYAAMLRTRAEAKAAAALVAETTAEPDWFNILFTAEPTETVKLSGSQFKNRII
jgi:hypothetical protein